MGNGLFYHLIHDYTMAVPSKILFVEAAACFLTSSALKEINIGMGGFLSLYSSKAEMICSAT